MLDKVKQALRIRTNTFDTELDSLIDAAKIDLRLSGIRVDTVDAIIEQAVIRYCKANFGTNTAEQEANAACYQRLLHKLKLSSPYLDAEVEA